MKILQVGSALYHWGGIERYILFLSQGLTERGHEVTLICPKGSPLDQQFHGPKVHIGLTNQHQISKLPEFVEVFKKQRYDVVNVHFSRDYVMAPTAARLTRQPFVLMTRHVVVPWKWIKVKQYMALFDHMLGVSGAVQANLMSLGVPEGFVSTAHAGVPPLEPTETREKTRSRYGIRDDKFVVGFFGRLEPEKGVHTLIEAASKLPEGICVEIFGDGSKRGTLESLAAGLPNVNFRGFISDVRNAMNAVDMVVVPSFWDEAFGYSVLEAFSVGKLVVATRTGGLPELVVDGRTGYLFNRGDSAQLLDLIVKLQKDPSLVERMGHAARERQRELFTVPQMAERIEKIYENARAAHAAGVGRALGRESV